MAIAIEFSAEQIKALLDPTQGHEALAAAFGCSSMPIRRWRKAHDVRILRTTTTAAKAVADPQAGPTDLELARDEIKQLRQRAKRDDKQTLGEERVLRAIEAACANVQPCPVRVVDAPEYSMLEHDTPHHRHAALWSDWHAGEVVSRQQMNGLNEFNWAILEERVDQLVKSMLAFKKVSPALTGLDIWALGDMASGAIHGLEETNDRPSAEQYVEVGYLMGRAIERLAPHYDDIACACIVGNHPRPGKEPASKDSYNSGDWIAYHIARASTSHLTNVTWEIPKSGMIVRQFGGKTFLLWHGDGVRSSMPGVPWGGVMRRVNALCTAYAEIGVHIDHVVVGHFHQRAIVPKVYMNGSLVGPNEYGLKNFGGGEAPKQLLLEFDEKRGRETAIKTISFEAVR